MDQVTRQADDSATLDDNRAPHGPDKAHFPWRIFTLIVIATTLLLLVIGYSFRLGHHMTAKYAPLVEATQGIRIEATLAHLWLEEIISGDESEDIATVKEHLATAFHYAGLLLNGGEHRGTRYLALTDPYLRQRVEGIIVDLERFRAITDERYQALGDDRPGSEIDRRFDATFQQFSDAADLVAAALKLRIQDELASFRQLQISLVLSCIVLASLLLALFYRYERQRATHLQQIYHANQQLDRLSLTDSLTGIPNRRFFDQQLQREWLRAQREQSSLTVAILDIDFFKRYNDHFGHVQGDDCLKQVATTIDSLCRRPADIVARYGGEEFTLILPNTEGAEPLIKRMGEAIEALKLSHPRSLSSDYVTASIGYYAMIPTPDSSAEELLRNADEALYKAKDGGRNRVERFQPPALSPA